MALAPWVLGVVLAILASFCAALGDNLVKKSFLLVKSSTSASSPPPPLWKRPLWVLGMFNIIALNCSLNIASYAFADASITIPFGGLHIVLNIPLARWLNGEKCSKKALGYNAIILLGVMVVLITGNHDSNFFTAKQLAHNLLDPVFVLCTIVLGLITVGLVGVTFRSRKASRRRAGLSILCGIVGSTTQVWAKTMSECFKDGAWSEPFTYFAAAMTIVLALTQVNLLNQCLDLYAAFFVVPIVNSVIIVVGSLYAAVYFQEMERWDWHSRVFVPFGIFLTSLGISLLATEKDKDLYEAPEEVQGELIEDVEEEEAVLDDELAAYSLLDEDNLANDTQLLQEPMDSLL